MPVGGQDAHVLGCDCVGAVRSFVRRTGREGRHGVPQAVCGPPHSGRRGVLPGHGRRRCGLQCAWVVQGRRVGDDGGEVRHPERVRRHLRMVGGRKRLPHATASDRAGTDVLSLSRWSAHSLGAGVLMIIVRSSSRSTTATEG